MDVVTIDFETYYDSEYSLSKITTEEYIRSSQFEVIGVSIRINDHPADWYSGSNVGGFLNGLDYTDKAICCHHTAFDGAILAWHYNINPRLWLDTMSMARPTYKQTTGVSLAVLGRAMKLGTKGTEVVQAKGKRRKDFTPTELAAYGAYCVTDNDICRGLFLKLSRGFPAIELQVIDATIRMFTEPKIVVDKEHLEKHLAAVKLEKQTLMNALSTIHSISHVDLKKVLSSNKKFALLLDRMGVRIPYKVSPRTGKHTYAFAKTDQGLLNLLEHQNPLVQHLVAARMGVKSTIEETRTQRLIDVSDRGTLPIMLSYYSAHTGRYGGGDKLNLQNLPARKGNAIRSALCAPEGYVLIACDSSQIEARMLAWVAGQQDLLEAFRQGRDVYSEFASSVYGFTVDKANLLERFVGKTSILGLGYGMGHVKFIDTLSLGGVKVEEHEGKRIVHLYRNTNRMIPKLWDIGDIVLGNILAGRSGTIGKVVDYDADGLHLPNGMTIAYSQLEHGPEGYRYLNTPQAHRKVITNRIARTDILIPWANIYGGKMVENIVQALARIVVVEQMLKIKAAGYTVLFQVHDENIMLVKADRAEAAAGYISDIMSTSPEWAPDLSVACEVGIGTNYGEAK